MNLGVFDRFGRHYDIESEAWCKLALLELIKLFDDDLICFRLVERAEGFKGGLFFGEGRFLSVESFNEKGERVFTWVVFEEELTSAASEFFIRAFGESL